MTRRPDHIRPRTAFPASVRRTVDDRSGGVCESLGCDERGYEYDHTVPVALGGKSDLANCQLLCRRCHRAKTNLDVKMIARSDRVGGRSGQYARREKAKSEGRYKPLGGQGFPTNRGRPWKQKIGGRTVRRDG